MKIGKRHIIAISLMVLLILNPLLIATKNQNFVKDDLNENNLIFESGFENEWDRDSDGDYYAPTDFQIGWDVDGICLGYDESESFKKHYWHDISNNETYVHNGTSSAGIFPNTGDNEQHGKTSDEWLVTPSIDLSKYYNLKLVFWSQYHPTIEEQMPFKRYRRVNNTYLVKASIDNGKTWEIIADLRDDDKYKIGVSSIIGGDYWNNFDEPILIPIDLVHLEGQKNVKIAWHYFYNGDGPAGRWIIDDVELTGKEDNIEPDIVITKPIENNIYFRNKVITEFDKTIIIGDIKLKADPTDIGVGTDYVEFYVNNNLKHRDYDYPYEWDWTESFFGKCTLKVCVLDKAQNENYVETQLLKLF